MPRFGPEQNPNLTLLSRELDKTLRIYAGYFGKGFEFGDHNTLNRTKDKPNTARTSVPLAYQGKHCGTLTAIVFAPGDGTGDTSTYQEKDLDLSHAVSFPNPVQAERIFPRKKDGVLTECMIPLFSVIENVVYPYLSSLVEYVLNQDSVKEGSEKPMVQAKGILGVDLSGLPSTQNSHPRYNPSVYLTTGFSRDGTRFGDPHAVYNPLFSPANIQIVGFFQIKEKDHPLTPVIDRKAIFPF